MAGVASPARVLQEGLVEADQAIEKIASGPEALSVNEIDALLYLPGHPRPARIALSMTFSCCPWLSLDKARSVNCISGEVQVAAPAAGGGNGWQRLRLRLAQPDSGNC
jgi:hypothetical protein